MVPIQFKFMCSGLWAACSLWFDLSYDIEIYLSIYLSIKFLSKHINFCYENLQCFVVQYEQDHVCKDHSVKISADSLPHLALASRLPPPIFPRKFPRKTRHRRAERWSSQRTFARISQSQPPGLLLVESAYLCFHISQYFVFERRMYFCCDLCLLLVNWNSCEPAQPITGRGCNKSRYKTQTTNIVFSLDNPIINLLGCANAE